MTHPIEQEHILEAALLNMSLIPGRLRSLVRSDLGVPRIVMGYYNHLIIEDLVCEQVAVRAPVVEPRHPDLPRFFDYE